LEIRHLIVMFRDRCRHPDDIRFLESIRTDDCRRYLTGKDNHRQRIHHRICNTCDQVGRPRPGSGNDDARLTCNPCVSFCCMDEPLLMSAQYVLEGCFRTVQGIVDRKDSTTRVTEYCINIQFNQRLNEQVCARSQLLLLRFNFHFTLCLSSHYHLPPCISHRKGSCESFGIKKDSFLPEDTYFEISISMGRKEPFSLYHPNLHSPCGGCLQDCRRQSFL